MWDNFIQFYFDTGLILVLDHISIINDNYVSINFNIIYVYYVFLWICNMKLFLIIIFVLKNLLDMHLNACYVYLTTETYLNIHSSTQLLWRVFIPFRSLLVTSTHIPKISPKFYFIGRIENNSQLMLNTSHHFHCSAKTFFLYANPFLPQFYTSILSHVSFMYGKLVITKKEFWFAVFFWS